MTAGFDGGRPLLLLVRSLDGPAAGSVLGIGSEGGRLVFMRERLFGEAESDSESEEGRFLVCMMLDEDVELDAVEVEVEEKRLVGSDPELWEEEPMEPEETSGIRVGALRPILLHGAPVWS